MRLDDLVVRYARATLECVNILRKACVQELVRCKELDEGVGRCGSEFAWVELMGEGVDYTEFSTGVKCRGRRGRTRNRIFPEEIYLKYSFWVREV
jgi:hypothetical protein